MWRNGGRVNVMCLQYSADNVIGIGDICAGGWFQPDVGVFFWH